MISFMDHPKIVMRLNRKSKTGFDIQLRIVNAKFCWSELYDDFFNLLCLSLFEFDDFVFFSEKVYLRPFTRIPGGSKQASKCSS